MKSVTLKKWEIPADVAGIMFWVVFFLKGLHLQISSWPHSCDNPKKCLNHLLRKLKRLVSFFLFYFPFNYFSHFLCRPSKRVVPNLPSQFSFNLFSNSRPTCQPWAPKFEKEVRFIKKKDQRKEWEQEGGGWRGRGWRRRDRWRDRWWRW